MSKKYDVFPMSAKMREVVVREGVKDIRGKYPWRDMIVGGSFAIPHADIKYKTLYNYCRRMGKKLNKEFHVVDHGEDVGYEVGRSK